VEFFLKQFNELVKPTRGKLNTFKILILMSTSDQSLINRMRKSTDRTILTCTDSLDCAIGKYSLEMKDGTLQPREVVDGLRVLGAPNCNTKFCRRFIDSSALEAKSDFFKLLHGLDNVQTALHLYSSSTVHKLTHLFSAKVLNTTPSVQPVQEKYFMWDSDLSRNFSAMSISFLSNCLEIPSLPIHA
jgi:hypothetical protein